MDTVTSGTRKREREAARDAKTAQQDQCRQGQFVAGRTRFYKRRCAFFAVAALRFCSWPGRSSHARHLAPFRSVLAGGQAALPPTACDSESRLHASIPLLEQMRRCTTHYRLGSGRRPAGASSRASKACVAVFLLHLPHFNMFRATTAYTLGNEVSNTT